MIHPLKEDKMNKNFTPTGKRIVVDLQLNTGQVVAATLGIFFSFLSTIPAKIIGILNASNSVGAGIYNLKLVSVNRTSVKYKMIITDQ